ncbi:MULTISPECIES: type I polyketide synthase [Paenibacillus]|uniref:type I polyketide synthase n=1 Tax=Paenibacillus TaxID=44249 RepID=UPI0004D97D40|nr:MULTISPECIES: type I polyketide synthase [Paenibacillus]KEO76200.1 hypothetical protein EL23_24325 [Paenibacillus polymyxa]MCH6190863.1 type I polyketide synthase [Paenibacillus polymyxa]UMY53684.1 type I polyketide synthase [Paenibacillus peoriae]WRL58346.1 type I polyketide synthase [Paenibacillus polymyxa]
MSDDQFTIDEILHLIKEGKMTSDKGFEQIRKIRDSLKSTERATTYYQPLWRECLPNSDGGVPEQVIVFGTDTGLWNSLKKRGIKAVLVQPGDAYRSVQGDIYEIDPLNPKHYEMLFSTIKQNQQTAEALIYAWSDQRFVSEKEELQTELERGIYSLFYLSKALMRESLPKRCKLLYVYQGSGQPQNAAVSGFARTLRKENPALIYATVELSESAETSLDQLLSEFSVDDEEVEIRYQQQKRFVRYMSLINELGTSSISLREKGTYMITGGLGGLGSIFAGYLASKYKARLVIAGRSPLTSEHEQKIKQWERCGASVLYVQADISLREQCIAMIAKAKERFGHIHGVIHAAGVLRDAYILRKSIDQIEEVLAAKLYGTVWLDEATRHEELDFFLMFSSIMSVIGNAGQCDYAYANAFMDYYAHHRTSILQMEGRSGKSLLINWPLWKEGGMTVDAPTLAFMENTMGILPISTEEGIRAFEDALHMSGDQMIVLKENPSKKIKLFNSTSSIKEKFSAKGQLSESDEQMIYRGLCEDIRMITSDILFVDKDTIEMDTDYSEYGFDSISTTDFINRVNQKFHLELTPPVFYEFVNMGSFVSYLKDNYTERVASLYTVNSSTSSFHSDESAKEAVVEPADIPSNIPAQAFENANEPIAIIGVACKMPQSDNLNEFWLNLEAEKDLITEIPPDRWNWEEYDGDPTKEMGKTNIRWGGFMKDIDAFDAFFFGISPREAELMDPRQRIFLETVWKVIEDAGYKASVLSGSRTGIFVGAGSSDYDDLLKEHKIEMQAYTPTGLFNSILTNRISYLLNFHGPSEPIDTACSSSLVAIHRAVESLRSGECEVAIAGGVNVLASPNLYIALAKAGMLSEDGRCKTFDKKANGYVRGEGSAAVMLKPLSQARRDGDHIYAVIRGTAVNHGGRANSLTAPNPNAQADLIVDAWTKSRVDPSTVSYIEVHGSGTSLGDPIEINGLKKAFDELYTAWGRQPTDKTHCGIGTVKTNIGHLESAAGIAGLIKIVLCLKHKKLLKTLHYKEQNPYIKLENSPFYIVENTKKWEKTGYDIPRRAGVSSFGFGGVNAHMVVEEYKQSYGRKPNEPQIFLFSAKNKDTLCHYIEEIRTFLLKPEANMGDIAFTLQIGREAMEERLAVVASSIGELVGKLDLYLQAKSNIENVHTGNVKLSNSSLQVLIEGEEGAAFMNLLLSKKKLEKLAQLWVKGLDIEWTLLHSHTRPQRVSLPTYPFEKQRYWVPVTKIEEITKEERVSRLHPLLHENTSILSEQRFCTAFTGQEFFVKEEQGADYKIVPAEVLVEMARAAVKWSTETQAEEHKYIRLENIVWGSPVLIQTATIQVTIALYAEDHDEISFEIYQAGKQEQEMEIFSQGYASLKDSMDLNYVDLQAARMDCNQQLLLSVDHLPEIGDIYAGADMILVRLSLPHNMSESIQSYAVHPNLIHAITQLSAIWQTHMENKRSHADISYHPVSIKELDIYHSCTSNMWAKLQYAPNRGNEDCIPSLDVEMCDEQGKVCIRIRGLVTVSNEYPAIQIGF